MRKKFLRRIRFTELVIRRVMRREMRMRGWISAYGRLWCWFGNNFAVPLSCLFLVWQGSTCCCFSIRTREVGVGDGMSGFVMCLVYHVIQCLVRNRALPYEKSRVRVGSDPISQIATVMPKSIELYSVRHINVAAFRTNKALLLADRTSAAAYASTVLMIICQERCEKTTTPTTEFLTSFVSFFFHS